MPSTSVTIERAQVTAPPPGDARLTILSGGVSMGSTDITMSMSRAQLYTIYYEMYRRHPWLRAGIDKIAKTAVAAGFSMVPEDNSTDLNQNEAKEFRAFARRSNLSQLRRMWYRDYKIFGEALGYIELTKGGRPWKAYRLHPKWTTPRHVDGIIVFYEYGTPLSGANKIYPEAQVLHFKYEDPDTDLEGLSALYSLMETVSQDLYAMRYNLSFFENSAQTGIVFNMRNASKEEAERNRTWLEQNYAGASNAHRPIILEGDIQIQKSVSTKQEMEYVEGRKVNRQEILAVLDINETLLGVTENANRSNSKENDAAFRDAIASLQLVFEEEINNKLILGLFGWDDILFEENDTSKRALLEQSALWVQLLNAGLMNRDEIRGNLGYGNIAGGDVFTVSTSSGLVPVEHIEDAFDQAQQKTVVLAPGQNPPPVDTQFGSDNPPPVGKRFGSKSDPRINDGSNAAQKREDRKKAGLDARPR